MNKSEVISFFGGVTATAKALGISHASVSMWGERVPLLRAHQIEKITKKKLRVEDPACSK
ncbi:Cro/CI family transcriptional regulator [Shewanella sp. T24-MNA-CIBAN-0130]|jgi:DNA-binding transcriptional regulator YdaS (Cro superfamily)|uniref:Cro/CI family transcriptional regulator n=1 Tax=Shewanella sp. T24-MNA-CIBAN-0130 TaxID=3140470 RepID=UPI0033329D33